MCDVRTCEIHWTVIITRLPEPHYSKDRVIQQQTVWFSVAWHGHMISQCHVTTPQKTTLFVAI